MKIISKYKDYYDYLSGIYGEDPKIILDRRESTVYKLYNFETKIFTLYICGYVINCLYEKGKFYYGENLKNRGEVNKYKYLRFIENRNVVRLKIDNSYISIKYLPYKDDKNENIKHNCPIFLKDRNIYKYPKLSDLELQQVYSPEEIYKMINQWLSDRITEKELNSDDIPNEQKIQNKGFDIKRSFRPKMK